MKWIDTREQMPEMHDRSWWRQSDRVFGCYDVRGRRLVGILTVSSDLDGENLRWSDENAYYVEVTHWAPLPPLPEEMPPKPEACPHCGHAPSSKLVDTIRQFREEELEQLILNGMLMEAINKKLNENTPAP